MSKFGPLFGAALLTIICGAEQAALAGSPITIQTDQTQLIAISADPGTVVVGNPSIADVSVSGRRVFLHGRGFGSTNIMILDIAGNQLANFDVTVTHDHPNELVMVTSSPARPKILVDTYSCAPTCYHAMIPGDAGFGEMVGANSTKAGLASGSKSLDAAPSASAGGPPPAAQ
jgi:Pilus formation protein N terminal region